MSDALTDYVEAFRRAAHYEDLIRRANGNLEELTGSRQQIIDTLDEIQASSAYSTEVQDAAQQKAAALRQAILDFAATL